MTYQTYRIYTQDLENYDTDCVVNEGIWKAKGGDTYKVTVPEGFRARNNAMALVSQELIINGGFVQYISLVERCDNDWIPSNDCNADPCRDEYCVEDDKRLKIISIK
jgi:hypothetical protein